MAKNILLIHGAWATRTCFNYIVDKLDDDHNIQYFEYDCEEEKAVDILKRVIKECKEFTDNGQETIVIGHSLGGILAMYLARNHRVSSIVTIAAPLSGIGGFNPFMHYFLMIAAPIFSCILPKSKFITDVKEQNYDDKNIDCIIACEGHSFAVPKVKTDGVVSVSSQEDWTPDNARVHTIRANHHEILQHEHVTEIIKKAVG